MIFVTASIIIFTWYASRPLRKAIRSAPGGVGGYVLPYTDFPPSTAAAADIADIASFPSITALLTMLLSAATTRLFVLSTAASSYHGAVAPLKYPSS
jgi:hypothetical protein